MRLLDKERIIIGCVSLHGNLTVAEIAERTHLRGHVVRYYLERLRQDGIIWLEPRVNLAALGFQQFGVFFALRDFDHQSWAKRRADLRLRPEVLRLEELAGAYDYMLSCSVRSVTGVVDLLSVICEGSQGQLGQKVMSTIVGETIYNRSCFEADGCRNTWRNRTLAEPNYEVLDEIDEQILYAVVCSGGDSLALVARRLGIASSTVDFRLKRLQQRGIWQGWHYGVDVSRLGFQTYKFLVETRRCNRSAREFLLEACQNQERVVRVVEAVGNWDLELQVEVETQGELQDVKNVITRALPGNVREIRILSILSIDSGVACPFIGEQEGGPEDEIAA